MLNERDATEPTAIDTRVFAPLVPPAHALRRVTPRMDVERFRDVVQDGYSPARGRGAADPVRLSTRACVPEPDHRSDRDVMAAAQVHGAFRGGLDRALERRVPVPSGLAPCRTRLGVDRHRALVDQRVTPARLEGAPWALPGGYSSRSGRPGRGGAPARRGPRAAGPVPTSPRRPATLSGAVYRLHFPMIPRHPDDFFSTLPLPKGG